jgi:VanZ family protein
MQACPKMWEQAAMVRSVDEDRRAGRRRAGGDGLLRGLRILSVVVAGIVAAVTLLPNPSTNTASLLEEGRAIGDELHGVLVLAIVGAMVAALVVAAWTSRIAWRLKMSWPLFLVGAVYLAGFAMLASATLRESVLALFSTSPAWLDRLSTFLDGGHAVAYAAFMIIVVMAWRDKLGTFWLALGLFAYGYALELGQDLVPAREYHLNDVVGNSLGIAIGLIGIHLFDLRAVMTKGRMVHVAAGERQRHVRGSSHRPSRRSSRSGKGGLVTLLVGLAISIVSILLGAIAELRFGRVASQIFTQFSAPYAFTFWVGILVTVLGGYTLHTRRSRRGARVRSTTSG